MMAGIQLFEAELRLGGSQWAEAVFVGAETGKLCFVARRKKGDQAVNLFVAHPGGIVWLVRSPKTRYWWKLMGREGTDWQEREQRGPVARLVEITRQFAELRGIVREALVSHQRRALVDIQWVEVAKAVAQLAAIEWEQREVAWKRSCQIYWVVTGNS